MLSIHRIYQIIEPADDKDETSRIYDLLMMLIIIISLIPLAFKNQSMFFNIVDTICVVIFIIDYIIRFITAEIRLHKGAASFFIYPITPWAIIDLISILPSFSILGNVFRILRVMRLLRSIRVFRAFKILRYSHNFEIIARV